MKVGVTLPQFRESTDASLSVARGAEAVGLDGVFAFDHLWPIGRPDRPALHSLVLLGAVASATTTVTLGTLVARVGLVPDTVLVNALCSLHNISGGRLIAGLGTGDALNREENQAYGVAFAPATDRLNALVRCCRALRDAGVPTWAGGRSQTVRKAALDAPADGWNAWGADVATMAADGAALLAAGCEVTWAGQVLVAPTRAQAEEKMTARGGPRPGVVVGGVEDLARHLEALGQAGVSWAVCAPLDIGADLAVPGLLAEAATLAR